MPLTAAAKMTAMPSTIVDLIDEYAACTATPHHIAFAVKYGAHSIRRQPIPPASGYQRYEWALPPYTREAARLFVEVPICAANPCTLCCPVTGPHACHVCDMELCEIHVELLAPVARGERIQTSVDLHGIDPVRYMGRVLHGLRLPNRDSSYSSEEDDTEDEDNTGDIDDMYKPTTDG